MRLTNAQIEQIKALCSAAFDSTEHIQLWLFGSRVNDALKGGDVDLCVIADASPEILMQKKLCLRPQLEQAIDLPVDLVMQSEQRPYKEVVEQAMQTGIRLT
jgi:predicted nucleotidyltransferase